MAVAEVIVICIDNSTGMLDSANFEAQLDAIKFYCQAKLDSNPENEVVLFKMGSRNFGHLLFPPTRDFQNILDSLRWITPGSGRLTFLSSIIHANLGFSRCPPHKEKRMLFFVGGLHDMDSTEALIYGENLKDLGIAVDVVNFYLGEKPKRTTEPNQFGRMELDVFINATHYYNNSHIEHVKSESPICDVLCKSILKGTPGLSRIKNLYKKTTGKNQAVDVVNFYLGEKPKRTIAPNQFGRMELDDATRCYNYSRIEHVKSESPNCDVLCKSILKGAPGLSRVKNLHQKATGKNQAEAATDNKHVSSLNRFEALFIAG